MSDYAYPNRGSPHSTLVGCSASHLDWRYPSKSPARANDIADGNEIAKPGISQRGGPYAGCKVAKGYQVRIGIDDRDPLGTSSGVPVVYMEATRPHGVSEAAQDLIECRRAARAAISGYATASMFVPSTPGPHWKPDSLNALSLAATGGGAGHRNADVARIKLPTTAPRPWGRAQRPARLDTMVTNSAGSTGLGTCMLKPAEVDRCRSSALPYAVRATAGSLPPLSASRLRTFLMSS